ncbi:MAG: hypothetical protein RMK29_11755 [Myxococcales bacterium]|nr:hypothetical protein [Myxococcales bacterium]
MRTLFITVATAVGLALLPLAAQAEGCYLCGSGSSPQCRDYCRYSGADTFDARKSCEKKGCRVVGPTSCPTGGTYAICQAPEPPGGPVLAQIPWCAPA